MNNSNQYGRGRAHETSPLRPQHSSTSYGVFGQTSGSTNIQPPPAYGPAPNNSSGGCHTTNAHQSQRDSSPPDVAAVGCCITFMLLIIMVQTVAIIFMRREAADDRVPQGAFWETLPRPAPDCLAYGKREYSGVLRDIPKGWTDLDACMNMPVEIKGVSFRRPYRCAYDRSSPHIHGYWVVDWDQLDCKPWHQDFYYMGCTHEGSGVRRIEAQMVGMPNSEEQDWLLLCETTPMTWNHVTYETPTHCEERRFGRKVAMWDIPDESC